jgi:hypothetical protein
MPEFLIIEEHPDFGSASRRAKVLASSAVLSALVPPGTEQTADLEDDSSSYDDDYQKEVVEPLIEEFQSDQDDWARSEEDGWFYEN